MLPRGLLPKSAVRATAAMGWGSSPGAAGLRPRPAGRPAGRATPGPGAPRVGAGADRHRRAPRRGAVATELRELLHVVGRGSTQGLDQDLVPPAAPGPAGIVTSIRWR